MSADRVSNPNLSCCWVCGADAEEYEGAKGTEYEGLFKVGCAAGNTDHDDEYPEGCAEEPETIWYPTAARAFTGCLNPSTGEWGPVAVVPEVDSCRVKVRVHDSLGVQTRVRYEMRPCDGDGHEVEVFGRRWW